ncbi:MAG: helix-turn-helix domain-containing protein [Streptococcaceae bacterium]|nr:helix-turn-helix domain-containing protein [Streptococcaceae bacterium]
MKTYGQIYKTLRQNKHISLREASGDIVSKSQLSRFENNLSELSFSKVLDILDNINVSYDEYMYLVRNYQRNEQILFFETVGRLEKLRKFDDLYALYMTEKEKNRKFYSKFSDLRLIAVKMVLNAHQKMAAPSPLEIEQLCDYLLSVVNWGQFELYLSLSAVAFVKLQTIKLFLEEIPQRIEFFQNSPENHRLLLMLYRNIIITSIVKKNQQLAQQVLQDYEASIQTSFDVNLHLEYKMLTAEYAFEFIDFQTGEQILSQVIEVYRNFGDLNTAELYQKEIELQKNLKL